MAKDRTNLERLLQSAYDLQCRKRGSEVGNSVVEKKRLLSEVFSVIEQPLVLGALFTVGGLVGALLFTPAFILCALCILFGVQRSGVLAGRSLKTQIPLYLALAVLLSGSGYFLYRELDKALERFQATFAKVVGDLVNHLPKESKPEESKTTEKLAEKSASAASQLPRRLTHEQFCSVISPLENQWTAAHPEVPLEVKQNKKWTEEEFDWLNLRLQEEGISSGKGDPPMSLHRNQGPKEPPLMIAKNHSSVDIGPQATFNGDIGTLAEAQGHSSISAHGEVTVNRRQRRIFVTPVCP